MADDVCPIWGIAADILETHGGGGLKVNSPRASGEYRITGEARTQVDVLSAEAKGRLTMWIVDRHRFGDPCPLIQEEEVRIARAARPTRMSERKDRFFQALSDLSPTADRNFQFMATGPEQSHFLAWTGCATENEFVSIARMLADEGYFNREGIIFRLTARGWQRLDDLETANADSAQGFIAMWFDQRMSAARHAILEGVRRAGYRPCIIDAVEHIDDVTDAIIAEIRRSRFVVADATCSVVEHEGKPLGVARAGVYYEAGFARALNLPVIWTVRKDCVDYLHFDTSHLNHIVWQTPEELRDRLATRIGALLGYGPDASVAS